MTPAKNLRQSLSDPNLGSSGSVSASAGPWTATANTPHRDKIGAEIDELTVERASPGPGSVKSWADRFTGTNIPGMLEPLKVQEVDAGKNEALIRSSPPSQNDAGTDYYEVKMHGTQKASVKRYHAEGGKRDPIPFTLTHDGIEKLVDGLTGSQK